MARKTWNWTNNKLRNAIRAAGWDTVENFCKDFNIQASTFHNWTGGKLPGIFDSRVNPLMVSELCRIFDCSKDELNSMVRNAYRVKHGHPEEEPKEVPLGDKDATFARYLAYDEKKKEENSNGEVPLEDFIKNENPDFFDEYSEVKAEVEDGKTVEEVAEEHNIPNKEVRYVTKSKYSYGRHYPYGSPDQDPTDDIITEKMLEAKENTESFKLSPEDYALIEETMYGKISYRKFKRLMNCIKYYCM